jgi:hypothetical protein
MVSLRLAVVYATAYSRSKQLHVLHFSGIAFYKPVQPISYDQKQARRSRKRIAYTSHVNRQSSEAPQCKMPGLRSRG